jgi:hypothetical protein
MTIKDFIKEMQELELKLSVSDISTEQKQIIRIKLIELYKLIYNIDETTH